VLHESGRHFLQLPGPTNVPDRVLRAMDRPLIDHRGPRFRDMLRGLLEELGGVFGADRHVFVFASSASGCWEAGLVNTLSPGDRVLAFVNGFFGARWASVAGRLGLEPEVVEGDWRRPVDADAIAGRLAADARGDIRAVLVVHNETSTGVTSDVGRVRAAIDACDHEALLMVDAVSSLGVTPVRHDEWGADVTISGSQKGLMLPPGIGLCAVSSRALEAYERAGLARAYWDWGDMLRSNEEGVFPSTPATALLFGLVESLAMLREEGLERVFWRHGRFAEATRRAVSAWGLDNYCADPTAYSNAGTTVLLPDGVDGEAFRRETRARFHVSLGGGLGPLVGRVFRVGHLGDFNAPMLLGTLAAIEMGLRTVGAEVAPGGMEAAMDYLIATSG